MNNHDRRERDFVRVIAIAFIALAIVVGMGIYSVYGPVHTTWGPFDPQDGPVSVEPS